MSAHWPRIFSWAATWALLWLLQLSMCSAMPVAGSLNVNRRLLARKNESSQGALRVEMMHMDSKRIYPSRTHRMGAALERSRARVQVLKSRRPGHHKHNFTTPVATVAGYGEYVMSVTLGSPPLTFSDLAADTGSDLTWVGCKPCADCNDMVQPLFVPTSSSSFQLATCRDALCQELVNKCETECVRKACTCAYTYGYGDGSSSNGDFAYDTITLSTTDGKTQSVPHFGFGCNHDAKGNWQGTTGLAGLGRGLLSLPSQLSSVLGSTFSYCLVSTDDSLNQTSPLVFGTPPFPAKHISYTPMVQNKHMPTYYYIDVQGISVGSLSLAIPASTFQLDSQGNGGMIVDSGTTVTQLPDLAYQALVQAVHTAVSYPASEAGQSGFDVCYNIHGVRSPVFPAITFHLTGTDLVLPQANSFVAVDDKGEIVCLAMFGGEGGPADGPSGILGNIQQQNFLIIYNTQTAQIGFAEQRCDSL